MEFDYAGYLDRCKTSEDVLFKDAYIAWVKNNGSLSLQNEKFYKNYLTKFAPIPYRVPVELKDEFDWDLLLQLIVSSPITHYIFFHEPSKFPKYYDDLPELEIFYSDDINEKRMVSELWSFQIKHMIEVNLALLIQYQYFNIALEKEKRIIDRQYEERITEYIVKREVAYSKYIRRRDKMFGF
ncbi:MAG TPA: hypothetical protein PLK75_00445 [Bacteroidales bacterium]|nr:hypothetical protein [Bacteroidales bacterium]